MRIDTSEGAISRMIASGNAEWIAEEFRRRDRAMEAVVNRNEYLEIEVQKLTIALRTADRVIKPLRDKAQRDNENR